MSKLIKHSINFKLGLDYVTEELENVNTLSTELLIKLDFNEGLFFSLLPDNANTDAKHKFRAGGILPPNPIEEYILDGKTCRFSVKKSIIDDFSILIFQEFKLRKMLCAVLDDVDCKPDDSKGFLLFDECGLFFQKESYYYFTHSSVGKLSQGLQVSGSFWHSLGVLTTANLSMVDKELSYENMLDICAKTELAFVGAYDGEGYVFWEKHPHKGTRGYFEFGEEDQLIHE
jgi:hypothetical protein